MSADSYHLYVLGRVEFVTDVSCDDGALADVLVADEDDLELLDGVAIGGKADAIAHIVITNNQMINQPNP